MRRARIWLVVLGAPLVAALVVGVWWARSGLPTRSGTVTLAGLEAEVQVRFDERGVPHVTANSLVDLATALGWLHANDRMTQLELGRRSASGRLSELIGDATLAADERARHLRLRETAEQHLAASNAESRAVLEAYARGVNAWLERQAGSLPPELFLLGVEPEPWTPVDSLCFHMLMARDLSLYRDEEQRRFGWLVGLELAWTRELAQLPNLEPAAEIDLIAKQLRRELEAHSAPAESTDAAATGGSRGSNNWALGASRTATGRPIVAGDPHLGLALPSLWYQATLRAPDYEATGMTLPGLPIIVIGQTQDLGWSFTNTELDVSDVYFEELGPDGLSVRRGDAWQPLARERQTIHSKDGDHELLLLSTDLGPFTPATASFPDHSLAWTGHEPFDPLAPFISLARARTIDEVDAAVAEFVCPVQNIVLALSGGELYFTLLGVGPERGRGTGRLPEPGWDPDYHWRGLATHDSKPRITEPALDMLRTANNDVRPIDFDGPFSADPDTWHREERIFETIVDFKHERGPATPGQCIEMQQDAVSLYALEIVGKLDHPGPASDEQAVWAFDLLTDWDGKMDQGPEPALFSVFESRLSRALISEPLAGLPRLTSSGRRRLLPRMLQWLGGPHPMGDARDSAPANLPTAAELLAASWNQCVEELGPDPADWDYTAMHTFEARHPMGVLPVLGSLFNRGPLPVAGSSTSIAAFSGRVSSEPWHERVSHGPSMRFVADVGDPDGSLAVLPGGQSGHPFDRHYDDQLEPFLAGGAYPVSWSEAAIEAAASSTLRLVP